VVSVCSVDAEVGIVVFCGTSTGAPQPARSSKAIISARIRQGISFFKGCFIKNLLSIARLIIYCLSPKNNLKMLHFFQFPIKKGHRSVLFL
jgi:hypothetical protein